MLPILLEAFPTTGRSALARLSSSASVAILHFVQAGVVEQEIDRLSLQSGGKGREGLDGGHVEGLRRDR